MLIRVAAVLFALQLLYLAVGNAIVRSGLITRAVSASEGFHLEYSSAYTLWPGHVRVRELLLRFEDYNVQFELRIGRAELDIALSQLPFKKFRVTQLDAEDTRFRMRHKLIVVGEDAERVAAYPSIRGFADPPYFTGVRSPPISDEEYDLWQVQIEDVTAGLSELWVQEYRYLGQAVARGSFLVRPARLVQVEPAELQLSRGTLTLGEHLVAGDVRGRIQFTMPGMDVQATEGAEVLREFSTRMRVELQRGRLDFLRAYLAKVADLSYSGAADWLFDAELRRGTVQPGSKVALTASPLRVRHGSITLEGAATALLERGESDSGHLQLSWLAPRLEARRGGSRDGAPALEGVSGELRLDAVQLDRVGSLGDSRIAVTRATFPSLGWLRIPDLELRGSASASASAARSAAGLVTGQARLSIIDARLTRGELTASGDLGSELILSRKSATAPLLLNKLEVTAERATLKNGDRASKPFAARLDASGLQVALEPKPAASGALKLHVSSTEALLPLLVSRTVQGVGDAFIDLSDLRASARVKIESSGVDVTGLDARDGKLRLRGHLSKRGRDPRGALLVSSGPLNVGVRIEQGTTAVSPFVSDDWLATAALHN